MNGDDYTKQGAADMQKEMANNEQASGSRAAPCSRLVLQQRYVSADMPPAFQEWHDHPEPGRIAWGKGSFSTLEENIRHACANYYQMSEKVEFRMVRRTDEVEWEYSANSQAHPPKVG